MRLLDKLPLATLTFVVGAILLIIAYIKGDLSIDQSFQNLLYLGGGSGAIGYVRNQAGKGQRNDL